MEKNGSKLKDFMIKHRTALISLVLCVAVALVFIPTLYRSQVDELSQDVAGLTDQDEIQTQEEETAEEEPQEQTSDEDAEAEKTEESSEETGPAETAVSGHPTGSGSQGQTSSSNSGSSGSSGSTNSGSSSSGSGSSGSGSGSDQGNTSTTPQEPEQYTCYLEVECHTILNNMDSLKEGKAHLVPSNGVIYSSNVKFTPGQSSYDVLRASMQAAGIQMDAEYNSLYDSAYIKGINNLYEFDCGPYSGWMYSVNGIYPNYGTSVYTLADGDRLIFSYTCDLGRDL
ncbi:MAG: DUF4430 domain-containing protein [Firmicutes bacterium]|nr:DUF4430 domain-containing protein [Bacillota bacterium]MBQ1690491.1 DUF4430 domain-containing protein [Bacillota bacterium]